MSLLYLVAAILMEVVGTTCMKLSEGFSRLVPSVLVFAFYGLSLGCLTMALKRIDVSVAYAIWSGLGTALVSAIGILWFKEPAGMVKFVCLGLIVLGVAGLHLSSGSHP